MEPSTDLTFKEAEDYCREKYQARLVSIESGEKQKFLEEYLQSKNIEKNVWIGFKYTDDAYQWLDGSKLTFDNWAPGSPKNSSEYCGQIQASKKAAFGKWSDDLCVKKKAAFCEKARQWPIDYFQNRIIEFAMPIGFVYIQLPDQQPPQEIWPSITWENISPNYEGVFFRVEGGTAGKFGHTQEENSPRLKRIQSEWYREPQTVNTDVHIRADGKKSPPVYLSRIAVHMETSYDTLSFTVSGGEVRPRNMAIRVWKRIQ